MTPASYLAQMALTAAMGGVLWAVTYPRRRARLRAAGRRAGPWREAILLVFFMFLAGLLALTLTPRGFWTAILRGERPILPTPLQGGMNLTPLRESMALLRYYVRHGMWAAVWVNFPGNILMFLPIGLFSALLMDKPRWWKSTFLTLALSVFIEGAQMFLSRATDVDDVILNTLGGLLGYWVYLVLKKQAPGFVSGCKRQ